MTPKHSVTWDRPQYRPVPLQEVISTEETVPTGYYILAWCPEHGRQPYLIWDGAFVCCSHEGESPEVSWLH